MQLYAWVCALKRFSHNVREALTAVLEIITVAEMVLFRIAVFAGFVYGVYALMRPSH